MVPAASSSAHTHAKSAFIYATVLEGAIRSSVNDGPVVTYRTGESFSEMPGDRHTVSENASKTEPAKLLAVFVVDTDEKELTTPLRKMRQLLREYQASLLRQCSWPQTIRSGSPEKCFSFRAAYVRLYRQTVQQQERERKHENKIVRRRACCERGHDCSSEPGRCSRSERGISQRRSCTQCPGGSRSDAARRCFIVPLDADAVTRQ